MRDNTQKYNNFFDIDHALLPEIDKLTLSTCYGSKAEFNKFMAIVKQEVKIKYHWKRQVYECEKYGIFFEIPTYNKHMYGFIHFCPTQEKLDLMQRWIQLFFQSRYGCSKLIALHEIELSYDIPVDSIDYDILARLAYWIVLIYGRNIYSTMCQSDDVKKCRNGAINGKVTYYLQSTIQDDKSLSSESLQRNPKASKHTKIYYKLLELLYYLRIEMTLRGSALRDKFTLNLNDFSSILDQVKQYPFSHFYTFKDVNYNKFMRKLLSRPDASKLNKELWKRRIKEARNMPVADKMRIMREAAKAIGIDKPYIPTKILTMAEAASLSLPVGWHVSDRSTNADVKRVQAAQEMRGKLKFGKPQDMAPERAELALGGIEAENPGNDRGQPKTRS